jgi:hypothetical protein
MRKFDIKSLRGKGRNLAERIKRGVDRLQDARDFKILDNSDRENLSRYLIDTKTPEPTKSNTMLYLIGGVVLLFFILKKK